MKSFEENFLEFKNSLGGESIVEASVKYWYDNYFNKKQEINLYTLLTGKIYSFYYHDLFLDNETKKNNKIPLVFFIGYSKLNDNLIKGLDLLLLPPNIRYNFFILIDKFYKKQIEENIDYLNTNNNIFQKPLKLDEKILDNFLQDIPYKHTYRKWNLKKIYNISEIMYNDWTKLVYLPILGIDDFHKINNIYNKIMRKL